MGSGEIKGLPAAGGELLASLEALATLGARLDGPYKVAAAYILARVGTTPAAQAGRRNAAIVKLRKLYFPYLTKRAAAAEIARALRVYQSTSWIRRDATLTEPPLIAIGTARELMWIALKAGDGKVLSARTIRMLLPDAPKAIEVAPGDVRKIGRDGRPSKARLRRLGGQE